MSKSKGWVQAGWVGRMGVAYYPKTKLYVLVTQYDDNVLFATSPTPNGNFEVKNRQHQIQNVYKTGAGDQTVFIDDDGQAILFFVIKVVVVINMFQDLDQVTF